MNDKERIAHLEQQVTYLQERNKALVELRKELQRHLGQLRDSQRECLATFEEQNTELVEKNLELLSLLKKQSGQSSIRQAFRLYWYLEGGETKTEALKSMLADLKEFTSQSRDNIPWSAIDPGLATLERERDEARYWLLRLYKRHPEKSTPEKRLENFRTYGDGISYLARLGLHPFCDMGAVQSFIAKVEGEL